MPTRVQGTLADQDVSDTYTLWRRPGRYRFELRVGGEGAAGLVMESLEPGGEGAAEATARWRPLEERPAVPGGSRITGVAIVGEARAEPEAKPAWVPLRVRISRATATKPVAYEFSLEGDEAR